MHSESWYRDFDFDKRKFNYLFQSALENDSIFYGRAFVNDEDRLVGFMLCMITEHFFGYDTVAVDMGTYILPQYRGEAGMAMVRSIKEYEKWAKRNGCKDITFGVSAGITDGVSVELYERLGYEKTSTLLHKKVHI